MENYFAKNLKFLRKQYDVDQIDLAKKLGRKSGSSISEWEKGEYTPKAGVLSDIARIFSVPLGDLMNKDLSEQDPSNIYEVGPQTEAVPILGEIAMGDPILIQENIVGYRYESPDMLPSGNVYYVMAKGSSMEPTIPDGSYVLIREQANVENGQIAAVLMNDDTEVTLKRVKFQGDIMMLVPDNSKCETYIITEDSPARILGRAVRFSREL